MTFSPRTWVVGEVVSAATMNQEIRDQFASMFDAWTTYTPTWTATTNPDIGNGTLTGRYLKIGRTVQVAFLLTFGSTTTYGSGTYSFGVPFTTASAQVNYYGGARLSVGSDTWMGHTSIGPGGTTCTVTVSASTTNPRGVNLSGTAPVTLAAGNSLRASLTYQSAT